MGVEQTGMWQPILALLLFATSTWGWGWLAERIVGGHSGSLPGGNSNTRWAFSMVLGLATLALCGGVLNLLELAYAPALWALLAIGWLVAVAQMVMWWRRGRALPDREGWQWALVSAGPALVVLVFFAVTLMPAGMLNIGDDLNTYLPRPVRMLDTGILAAGPFALIGVDSLGVQGFFHAFLLLVFPLTFLNGFDAVFCQALSVALAIGAARFLGGRPWHGAAAAGVVLLVNIQQVNISANYALVAGVLGLFFATEALQLRLLLGRGQRGCDRPGILRAAAGVGLLLAFLVALKFTAVVYAGLFFLCLFGGLLATRPGDWRRVGLAGATTAGAGTLALLPWLVSYRETYLATLRNFTTGSRPQWDVRPFPMGAELLPEKLFSTQELFLGGFAIVYSLLALILAVLCGVGVWQLARRQRGEKKQVSWVVLLALLAPTVVMYLVNPFLIDVDTAIRYSLPFLVASLAVVTPLGLAVRAEGGGGDRRISVVAFLGLMSLVSFLPSLGGRLARAGQQHSVLSYPVTTADAMYVQHVVAPDFCQLIRHVQQQVEPGAGLLAWIATPHCLDFARNRVWEASAPGLLNPALSLGLESPPTALSDMLRANGIRYVLWEYQGFPIATAQRLERQLSRDRAVFRRLGWANLRYRKWLSDLATEPRLMLADDHMILLDLDAPQTEVVPVHSGGQERTSGKQ
ncbi:MAG: hypothetical protein OEW11_05235 [Nitrospirota bacterium]|nr:hypothetical protein [Nitrospirota bacterium]